MLRLAVELGSLFNDSTVEFSERLWRRGHGGGEERA
jgi:hypothetical protein